MQVKMNLTVWYLCFLLLVLGCSQRETVTFFPLSSIDFEIDESQAPKMVIFRNQQDKIALEQARAMAIVGLVKQLYRPRDPIVISSVLIDSSSEVTVIIDELEPWRQLHRVIFEKRRGKWVLINFLSSNITLKKDLEEIGGIERIEAGN